MSEHGLPESAGMWWGWIIPMSGVLPKVVHDWGLRRYLRLCLEDTRFPEGRSLDALRRAAGQPDTDEGLESTRELLRHVTRGRKRARILLRSNPTDPEMWGLRES